MQIENIAYGSTTSLSSQFITSNGTAMDWSVGANAVDNDDDDMEVDNSMDWQASTTTTTTTTAADCQVMDWQATAPVDFIQDVIDTEL